MMYIPKHFEVSDRDRAIELMRGFPFATVISFCDTSPSRRAEPATPATPMMISHLPMLIEDKDPSSLKLFGHMSRHNPQSSQTADGQSVTIVFHGPHAYITPKWYAENDVPTWNYAVVHATGKIRWISDFRQTVAILQKTARTFEEGPDPWKFFIPEDLRSPEELTQAIIGFEVEVTSLETKFKLNQNRSEQDRRGVIEGLGTRSDEMSKKVREMMIATLA